jgi:hypothetical protein
VGVDIAEGMLAVARRDDPQLDFRPGDAVALWDGLLAGSVRSAAAVEALSPAARERARAAFAELVEPYRVAGGHERLALAKVGAGRGP